MIIVKSILMICRGNICRSPMAEGFFNKKLNDGAHPVAVTSAGIAALTGYRADNNALKVMQSYQVDISQHRARQLTESLVRKADLILVMTQSHLDAVTRQYFTARGKTFLLGHWGAFEIKDPYTQSYAAFEKTYEQINLAWQDWKTRISPCQI